MHKIKILSVITSIALLTSCGLVDSNSEQESSQLSSNSTESSRNTESISSEISSENEQKNILSDFSDEEIEYARVWANFGQTQDVVNLKVTLIPKDSLINPNDADYGVYTENVIEVRGPKETDGNIVYSVSDKGSGNINIYPVPYNFDSTDSQSTNIKDAIETVYIEPGEDEKVAQLATTLEISERTSFITQDAALDLYEKAMASSYEGSTTILDSEFYSREYFQVMQDTSTHLLLSFENHGRGGQDYYLFKGEDDSIIIENYFETYEKDTPDQRWVYDTTTSEFIENSIVEENEEQNVIQPFTEDTAFEYIKENEGFSDDIVVDFSDKQNDGALELTLVSQKMKENGGSGTVDIFVIYPNGNYFSKNE